MIKLSDYSTKSPKGVNKKETKKEMKKLLEELADLQYLLQAEGKHSLLVILQGMDASGKDGVTKNVFGTFMPSGINVTSFKKPTDEEFAHDFLWRVHKQAPEKGKIKVFVRSHYEDILIQRVHKWISEEQVTTRINAINAWETLLRDDNHTTVLKFYLHLSKERQKEKLIERIEDPDRNWKHNDGDWEERKLWDQYRAAYEDAINRSEIPWIIAPVDSRTYRNYFIASKVLETLRSMNLQYPPFKEKPMIDYNG